LRDGGVEGGKETATGKGGVVLGGIPQKIRRIDLVDEFRHRGRLLDVRRQSHHRPQGRVVENTLDPADEGV
ncbi:hypothetical protein E4U61_003338, partial [Claviceps capensis]